MCEAVDQAVIVPNALSVVPVEAFTWPARGCRSEVKSPTPIRTREVVSAGMGALPDVSHLVSARNSSAVSGYLR